MPVYVTDTHPLIWHTGDHHSKLSAKVSRIFSAADRGQTLVYVPAVSFIEISMLVKRHVIAIDRSFEVWMRLLLAQRGFACAGLDQAIVAETHQLSFDGDPFDRIIVATARVLDVPLITRDAAIVDSGMVDIEW